MLSVFAKYAGDSDFKEDKSCGDKSGKADNKSISAVVGLMSPSLCGQKNLATLKAANGALRLVCN